LSQASPSRAPNAIGALELTLGVGGAIGVDQHRAEGQAQAGVVRRELHAFVEDCARRGPRRPTP